MKGGKLKEDRLLRKLRRLSREILAALRVKDAKLSVFLLPDTRMKQLKRRFFKVGAGERADILSFPEPRGFPHPESRDRFLGEIYLNRDLKDAGLKDYGFLLIHGLLHLLGCTHKKKSDILKMEKLERRLKKLLP